VNSWRVLLMMRTNTGCASAIGRLVKGSGSAGAEVETSRPPAYRGLTPA
jgi:hypothetical protein